MFVTIIRSMINELENLDKIDNGFWKIFLLNLEFEIDSIGIFWFCFFILKMCF